jgi:uncharacterized protein
MSGGDSTGRGRRAFLGQAAGLTWALTGRQAMGEEQKTAARGDLIGSMAWMNEPASWKRTGDTLTVQSRGKTDFWRKTFLGYINDNGHFLRFPTAGEFTFEARVNGRYAAQYDQAGLMVRLDAENWMKCGTEFFDGKRHASVVFTRDFSDWSTMADLSDAAPVWWRAVRKKDSIETLCSLDGRQFTFVRHGYFPPDVKVDVGIMCAAPVGPGFEAVFDAMKLEVGAVSPS